MENENKVLIGDKEYTREELLAFGKKHYPKFYWIPRGVGLFFITSGLLTIGLLLLFAAINKSWLDKSNYINWRLWAEVIVAGVVALGGLISFIISFKKIPDENYIKHATDYYTKLDANTKAREDKIAQRKERQTVNEMLKYKKLLDAGAITQEEYDNKKKEILGE